jgi:hypothetical protein
VRREISTDAQAYDSTLEERVGREGELLIPRGNIFQELLRKRASMQPSGKIGGLVDLRYTVPRLAKNYYNELLDTCRMRHGK